MRRRTKHLDWVVRSSLVLVAMTAPAMWLAPGCGAKTGLEESESETEEEDAGTDAAVDSPVDSPVDAPVDSPVDSPVDAPVDSPVDAPMDVPVDVPMDSPEDSPVDSPMDSPEDSPEDSPMDSPEDSPVDSPMDSPVDSPMDAPNDGPCPDNDGDGYGVCDNDCNDADPLINPGAFDFPDGVDNDCNGGVDNPILQCDSGLKYESQSAVDYAKAIDICQNTTVDATGAAKIWGLITAELRLADGTGTPAAQSHAIVTSFGNVLGPRKNANFVYFSTGLAGVPGQPYYQDGTPQGGTDTGTVSAVPPGFPTNKSGCPLPFVSQAFNPTNLKLTIRTPTNAKSFGFDHSFFSAEYPEYACSTYNDLWVVLLKTGAAGIANNHNVVFDNQGTPGSVNLNFFDRCLTGPTGCFGTPGFNFCSGGAGELAGTGYGDPDSPCLGVNSSVGGGTGWLKTESPIKPGEVITVEFITWDSSDGIYDSGAIFDNFHWLVGSLANPKTYR